MIVIGFETTYYTVWEANTTISICCEILHTNLTLGRPLEIGVVVLSNLTTATGKFLCIHLVILFQKIVSLQLLVLKECCVFLYGTVNIF